MDKTLVKPFSTRFLSQFVWAPQTVPFTNKEILLLDGELLLYEQISLNPDIERNLISKNELLASFAISKAENSELTLKEAQDVYDLITKDPDLDRWRSRLRMPYEATFSKLPKRARYRGKTKVGFQNFGESICYNLKKAIQYLPTTAYS